MVRRQPSLPALWLVSDARNDAVLERALARLPRGSGFIYRHYHLDPAARRARFERLARIARRRGHVVLLSGTAREARRWRVSGVYGQKLACVGLSAMTAHSLREVAKARRARADMVLISPVFPTRSHSGAKALGPLRFRLLAARAKIPAIALGGMNPRRAKRLRISRWAAIDGLSSADS